MKHKLMTIQLAGKKQKAKYECVKCHKTFSFEKNQSLGEIQSWVNSYTAGCDAE